MKKLLVWQMPILQIPNQLNTRFGIASITKPMTVVILNRLIEEKKIAPEDKLSKYIPDFPNGEKITIDILTRSIVQVFCIA